MDGDKHEQVVVQKKFRKFGTEIDFQIVLEDESQKKKAEKDLVDAERKCDEFEKVFSRFKSDSELSFFNDNLGRKMKASPLMLEVARIAIEGYDETEGYFDPRIIETLEGIGYGQDFSKVFSAIKKEKVDLKFGELDLKKDLVIDGHELMFNKRMDFTGLVKGFVVDQIADFFHSCGRKNFIVDCGGDMFFGGRNKNSNPWYIDIEGVPFESVMLELSGQGIATSGVGKRKWEIEGERFHHLVNPKNPSNFSFELKSVTVVDALVWKADILAKSIFLMGKEKGFAFCQAKKVPCVILDYKGAALLSTEIKKYLHKNK